MASGEKIYVGNGKERHFGTDGYEINFSLTLDGLKKYFEEYGFTTDGGKHILKIKIQKRKEKDQFGCTHYGIVDTWKPDSAGTGSNSDKDAARGASNTSAPESKPETGANETPPENIDDIPF